MQHYHIFPPIGYTLSELILAINYLIPNNYRIVHTSSVELLLNDGVACPVTTDITDIIDIAILEHYKKYKLDIIQPEIDFQMEIGMPYIFTVDGIEYNEIIQTRDRDKTNLTALCVKAQALLSIGYTGIMTKFRTESNREYEVTTSEIITLTDLAMAHLQEKYKRAWMTKDAITNAASKEEIDSITWYDGIIPS